MVFSAKKKRYKFFSHAIVIFSVLSVIAFTGESAQAVQYSGITLTGPETIEGLDDAAGPRGGDPDLVVTGPFTLTIDGIGGVYSGTVTDGTTLVIQNADQTFLSANDYAGGTTIGAGGILRTQHDAALGLGSVTVSNGGSLVAEVFDVLLNDLDVQAGGVLDLSFGSALLTAGNHTISGSVVPGLFGGLTLQDNAVLDVFTDNALGGVIFGFAGTGTLNLNGTDQTIDDTATTTNSVFNLGGGTLSLSGDFNQMQGVFSGPGTVKVLPGAILTAERADLFQGGAVLDIRDSYFELNGFDFSFTEASLLSDGNSRVQIGNGLADPSTLTLTPGAGQTIQLEQINGVGTINKTGAGTLRLGGSTNYTGAFNVNQGTLTFTGSVSGPSSTLTIASGATLTTPSTGQVIGADVINNGRVLVAAGNQMLIADYTGNGILEFGLTDATRGRLQISTAMTLLPGSSVAVSAAPGGYTIGNTYQVVDLFGGALMAGAANINGQTITTPLIELQVAAADGADQDVILTVTNVFGGGGGGGGGGGTPLSCGTLADTRNRCEVLRSITTASGNTGDIGDVYAQLQLIPTEDGVRQALDALSGDLVPQMPNVILRQYAQFEEGALGRLGEVIDHDDALLKRASAGIQLASAGADMQQQLAMLMDNASALLDEQVYAMTEGAWGRVLAQHDNARHKNQLNAEHYGLQVGFDTALDDDWTVGITGAFTTANVDLEDRPENGDTDSYQLGAYGAYTEGAWRLSGLMSYGYHTVDYQRDIAVGNIQRRAFGDYDVSSLSAAVEGAYAIDMGHDVTLTPAAALRYSALWQEGFSETGASEASLRFDDEFDFGLTGVLSMTLATAYDFQDSGILVPALRVGIQHDFGDQDRRRQVTFSGLPGAPMSIGPADEEARTSAVLGMGFDYVLPNSGLILVADYDGAFNQDLTTHRFFAGLRMNW